MCSCHSILECCVTFSGVKLSIRSFVLFLDKFNVSKSIPSCLLRDWKDLVFCVFSLQTSLKMLLCMPMDNWILRLFRQCRN